MSGYPNVNCILCAKKPKSGECSKYNFVDFAAEGKCHSFIYDDKDVNENLKRVDKDDPGDRYPLWDPGW